MLDIAVVGIGCRFPGGATNPDEFWKFLLAKGDGISEVPADRWSLERFYDPDPDAPGRMYTKSGGFLTQSLWEFDPEYFGISPREASIMDPQQRLLLEVAVEALDDAGLGGSVAGRDVGVYIGGFTSDNMVVRHSRGSRSAINSHTPTSGTFTMLSNRLSYVMDLHGPSMTIDTACSSSLVAIHQAAQAVARGECEVALAGGVNAMLQPETFISMCKGRFLAPDGHCKTFDASADGYARGEGSGIVVLKPLATALADGDRVYAVIRATGVNQDGRTSGITVPNPVAQEALARRVLADSGLAASDIGYVEAHGTGTAIGDPLEMAALGATYGDVDGRHTPLVVGSVKASVGHMEAAAGVASLIKAVLTVYHSTIAPQAWLQQLNPAIPFEQHRIEIPTEVRAFPPGYRHTAAAINGFGYGGTNAHVVLSALEAVDSSADSASALPSVAVEFRGLKVFPISGRNEAAARAAAASMADIVDVMADVAALEKMQAAAWGRRLHHPLRTAFTWIDPADLATQLRAFADGGGRSASRVVAREAERPVFVFTGMGPQWWRMGRDLLTADGIFAATAREIDAVFVDIAGWSIIEVLMADEQSSRVGNTEFAQPANFLVQVALTAELAALGIVPSAILGHSVGEVSAAYISGALSLHDALLVSYHRARLQATTAGSGGLLAVGLAESDVRVWLPQDNSISVAAINSFSSVTLAGDNAVLAELAERLTAEGIFARALRVEVPYHSHLMDPILGDIRSALADVVPSIPRMPLYSSVTSAQVTDESWGASYWVDNVRQPVRFAAAIESVIADGHRVFLEVGPHPVLGGNIREILVRGGETGAVVSTLSRQQDDVTSLSQAAAELYAAGSLDTSRTPGAGPAPVPHQDLPAYPWQRTRMWTEDESMTIDRLGSPDRLPMLGERTEAVAPEWQLELSSWALPWLTDHVVDGLVLLPGAAYLDAAMSAASLLLDRPGQALEDVRFLAPRIIDAHDVPVLRLAVEPSTLRFGIDSRRATDMVWAPNVTGRIVNGTFAATEHVFTPAGGAAHLRGEELYTELDARGLSYGPSFRGIRDLWSDADAVVARVDAAAHSASGHLAHPATTDAALQCVAALVAAGPDAPSGPVVPFGITSVRRFGPLPAEVWVAVRRLDKPGLHADIALADKNGVVALEMLGVEFRPVRPAGSVLGQLDKLFYEVIWERLGSPSVGVSTNTLEHGQVVIVGMAGRPGGAALALQSAHPSARIAWLPQDGEAALAPGGTSEVLAALRSATGSGPLTVVFAAPPASALDLDLSAGLLATARAIGVVLAEAELDGGHIPEIRGVVVTEQAFGIVGDVGEVQLGHAGLVGIRRTLRNEQPGPSWRLVDVEAGTPGEQLAGEVFLDGQAAAEADEVAIRGGLRLVSKVKRNLSEHLADRQIALPMTDPQRSFRVEVPSSNLMADLSLREVPRVAPGLRQVEVRLFSAGLNYKDAAKAIGLLTEKELAGTYFSTDLGMEAIGEVVGVGADVTEYALGDRLSIGVRDSLARYLTVDLDGPGIINPAPTTWSDTDSALTLPFLTAHHCLVDAARVEAGEWVLIQGAAGGVGLAAVQVAKRLGAIVIGTAGAPDRRDAVLAAGADHVLDSRSLDFVAEIRSLTDGHGVDVVLNSAPGEVVGANLAVAAEFGRIVEIGKAGIYGGGLMPLAQFDRNLSFLAVDIDRMVAFRRSAVVTLSQTVNAAFESGLYVPLPTTVYPLSRLQEAFEAVVRATHIGRVVLDFRDEAPLVQAAIPTARIKPDASYLITGGFGAFGLATARWLVGAGARHLVLAGRQGASTVEAKSQVESFLQQAIEITEVAVDVASPGAVDELIGRLAAGSAPLRGIFHAAGVLDDRPFAEIDAESLRTVNAPKAIGAWNLHLATSSRELPLDYFVLYSSATAVTGTVPQANYAGANSTLDSLARLRRAAGLHGLSVNWGALSGGMAGSSDEVERYLAMIGLATVDMDVAAVGLGEALALDVTHVGILDIDWLRWGATHPDSAGTPRFAEHVSAAGAVDSDAARLVQELMQLPAAQRVEVIAFMLAEQLAVVLGIPAETIDLDTALPDLGMDSLMAVEMQARINLALSIEVSALEFSRAGGLSALAVRLLPQFGGGAADDAPADAGPVAAAPVADAVVGVGVSA